MSVFPYVHSRIRDAALNPDLWIGVFRALIPRERGGTEVTFYRQPLGESKRRVAVRVLQSMDDASPEAELVTASDAAAGPPAIEFRLDDDLYDIRVTSTGPDAALLSEQIQAVKDDIIYSVKVNRAHLSTKTCFCGQGSLLGGLQDPIFRLTPGGIITWQNESASDESWQRVYTCGVGKSLTLPEASEQSALRSALSDIGGDPENSVKTLRISVPDQTQGAILALKPARACFTFKSPWVELFKPAQQAIAVIRRWDSKPNLSPSALRRLYGLTAKEAELAISLAQGASLKEYAERAGVSFETARWHSKRLMQKMDCGKQQDVMYALLYRNALFSILE